MFQSVGKFIQSLRSEIQQFLQSPAGQAIPEPVLQASSRQYAELKQTGKPEAALPVGAQAPHFDLEGHDGQRVELAALLARGPVVLTFFRGNWCSFCNLQLKSYQRIVDSFKEQGAVLVAISPQSTAHNRSLNVGAAPDFLLLSDPGNATASAYGLTYRITEELQSAFGALGLSLSDFNGDTSNTLPLAATYVVGSDGRIAYRFVSADQTERAEPADILAALKGLRANPQHII